ncbi:MAG: ATP-binding cassette domain-containing protein [Firmicutes bacterium]|nr:ATP-binding cassette domain-containing protein [Bacillota bacterium]
MRNSTTRIKLNKNLLTSALVWLVIWQVLALSINNVLLLPGPLDTARALLGMLADTEFYMNAGWTVARSLLGMVFSFVTGAAAAWAAYRVKPLRTILALPVGFFKAVPVMAIIIYVILLAKADWVAVIVCFFMCFPVVYINVLEGFDSTSEELLEVAHIYELTPAQKRRLIYWPGALPQIKASIKLITGLSWKAVVAAEVLSIPQFSLGYEMMNAKYYLETEKLFAYIVVIVILSLCLEKLINKWATSLEPHNYEGSKLGEDRQMSKTGPSPEIRIKNLSKSFGEKKVLDGVYINFEADKTTVIMEPSGRGKTTLMRIIAGLETKDSGEVISSRELKTSMLFQEDRLIPWLNIYDNLLLSGGDKTSVVKMAESLEIEDVLWKLPKELSGGMNHRVALGRTFLTKANLMILDEPFRGLDNELKNRIIDRLWERVTTDKTVLVVTHNSEDAKLLGDIVIEDFCCQ